MSSHQSAALPEPIAKDLNRFCRRIHHKRVNSKKQALLAGRISLGGSLFARNPGESHTTLWDLQRLKSGYTATGRDPQKAALLLDVIKHLQKLAKVRFGKHRRKRHRKGDPPLSNSGTVRLTGGHVPRMILDIIEWSAKRHGIDPPELHTLGPLA